jgi:hypothetical protein
VSFIAQLDQTDVSHGVLVSEAAHSDCGKAAAEETAEPTDTESTDATAPTAEAGAPLDPAACAAAGNHGEYVSFIAHLTKSDPTHGVLVSAAAHSDCGKAAAEETATETEGTDSADDATAKVKKEHKPKKDKAAKTHGKSGQSHGKGKKH